MSLSDIDRLLAASTCFGGATYGGWTLDLAVTGPLLLTLLLYARGVERLWRKAGIGHGARWGEVWAFAGGWLIMALALVTPLHDLSRGMFAAHMLEHELVMLLAAPLLVLAKPLGPMLWAVPQGWRRALGAIPKQRWFAGPWQVLTMPLVATVLHAAAIWLWHAPELFRATLTTEWLHWVQHLSFFITALLFWWALLHGRARERGYGAAVLYVFVTALHTGFLGILITFARQPIYYGEAPRAAAWGLDALGDQQIAGLIMWVPAGVVYAAAGLTLAGLWIARSSRHVDMPGEWEGAADARSGG